MWFAAVYITVIFASVDGTRLRHSNPPIFHPETDNIGGMRVLYAAPPGAKVPKPAVPGMPPPLPNGLKGIAMLFHACGRNSADWFQLPEESAMVEKLFQREFAVVAPTEAPGAPGGCWVPTVDTPPVLAAMKFFLSSRGLDKLPLYGIGLSSGGGMASSLQYAGLQFAGLHLNSSPGGAKKNSPGYFTKKGFPPTSFVYFPADTYAAPDDIRAAETALVLNRVPVQILELQPKPVTDLAARVEAAGLGPDTGPKLVQQLEKWNLVENRYGQNYMMMASADQALSRLVADPAWNPIVATKSKMVYEELHAVEGIHGPSVEYFDQSLDFLLDPTHNPAAHEPPAVSSGGAAIVPFANIAVSSTHVPQQVAAAPLPQQAASASVQPMPAPAVAPVVSPEVRQTAPFLAAVPSPAMQAAVVPVKLPTTPAAHSITPPTAATLVTATLAPKTPVSAAAGGMTCPKRATGRLDGSLSQRVLMLSPKALKNLEGNDEKLGTMVKFLCTCLKVRIEARPASQTQEAALMLLAGQTLPLPDEGRSAESPDIDLRAAKVVLCHGEAESECKQCASWDPFTQGRKPSSQRISAYLNKFATMKHQGSSWHP